MLRRFNPAKNRWIFHFYFRFFHFPTNRNSRREMVWCEENQRTKRTEEPGFEHPTIPTNCSFVVFFVRGNDNRDSKNVDYDNPN